jgi:hypothetical protein
LVAFREKIEERFASVNERIENGSNEHIKITGIGVKRRWTLIYPTNDERRVRPNRQALIREALARLWSGRVASWSVIAVPGIALGRYCLIPIAASQDAESGDPSNRESTRTPNGDRSGKTALVRDPWGAHNHRRRRLSGPRSRV